ncbi:hypothetical protein SERLA73DRAFT_150190 [Serpula lacrymans var. lacrymans S7.3]|uniref:Uncharacterized protein n=1 Tax=Serpula lacrymans var. lacrymans (strain S7.3) TaxID=936435 RepID=F8PLF3_SERL3|nr:hypothetical protein SERLA73DRAFT_150190 [Serpula lacrymans var. lacrymans S7.3]
MVFKKGKNIITVKEADAQHQASLFQLAKLQVFHEGNAQCTCTQITLEENAQHTQLAVEDMQLKWSAHELESLKIQFQMGITRPMNILRISPEVSHFPLLSASIKPTGDFKSNNSAGGSALLTLALFVPDNLDFGLNSNTVVFDIDGPNSQAINKYILSFDMMYYQITSIQVTVKENGILCIAFKFNDKVMQNDTATDPGNGKL